MSVPFTNVRPHPLRQARRQHRQRVLAVRSVRDSLVSLAGLLSRQVLNQAGEELGRLVDVVARWDGQEPYPAVTGLLVKAGRRVIFVSAEQIHTITHSRVTLRSAKVTMQEFERRPGEVMLARDVVDHQLVDVDGVQVIRAADLYLATVPGPRGPTFRLVGVDVSVQTLVRRLGPKRWRVRPTPDRVIDWAAIQPFGSEVRNVRLRSSHEGLRRLRPGELADLLEDLGRDARQDLLARLELDTAADALEEMDPEELGALLRETPPEDAAELLARMEPDEAVDALRDLEGEDRDEILEHMEADAREELEELLEYEEDQAGGFMTTNLVIVTRDEHVSEARDRLRAEEDHAGDLDGVVIVDDNGRIVGDISLFRLAIAQDADVLGRLLAVGGEPVTVPPDATLAQVAERLTESRRSSVVVVDDEMRPIGRILADDVVDALVPERGRFHFHRLLS